MHASGVYNWLRGEPKDVNAGAKDDMEFVRDYLIPK